ncbi:hypothetical protein KUCAC02_026841 [Chaenocephalus aceratus]|nr:hypothetical protein KUCAC02_026841 [Chaenocephalus aceratus]
MRMLTVATALMERLGTILPDGQQGKLIAQACDGAAVKRGAKGGVQRKVKDVYGSAHDVHCYVHQLNLIMQQATSHIPKISAFFSRSFKRTAILDQVVAHRLPGTSTTRWNFHSRAVNTVYEQKENILKCFRQSETRKRNIDSVYIKGLVKRFTSSIQAIR